MSKRQSPSSSKTQLKGWKERTPKYEQGRWSQKILLWKTILVEGLLGWMALLCQVAIDVAPVKTGGWSNVKCRIPMHIISENIVAYLSDLVVNLYLCICYPEYFSNSFILYKLHIYVDSMLTFTLLIWFHYFVCISLGLCWNIKSF